MLTRDQNGVHCHKVTRDTERKHPAPFGRYDATHGRTYIGPDGQPYGPAYSLDVQLRIGAVTLEYVAHQIEQRFGASWGTE